MKPKVKTALIYIFQPRTIILLFALFNFGWFFSQSNTVQNFGSKSISFCCYCAWYWDWSMTNLASMSLVASFSMFFARWKGFLAAFIISGYQIIEGINWLSNGSGFLGDIPHRIEIILDSNSTNIWELLDFQYLFALIIFVTALIYLTINIAKFKQSSVNLYP